ncbi:short-chain dehydrogenase/reductase SDR [Reticulomyxa filosa]|uniref:Short-chain dehydrogenase/reductase SDR n=1 Tax=Reticulomyxa filosa TaxID=46433 RepID=X6NXW8_RETFI|nr:short-chain dehydrogenase/reductase SDR [Reticulomyxa filosa]|eukprot:ETO30127.1 short-chain dehydrogenase/reductase SDR [Reticulomyxa filosa]
MLSEDLEWCLRRLGLDVTVVNPGWVKTPMLDKLTTNYRWMFALEADACAKEIRDGLERNVGYIDFPWNVMFMSWYIGGLHPILRAIVAYTCCKMPMRWIRRKFPPNPSQIKLRSYANSLLRLRQQPDLINAMINGGQSVLHQKGNRLSQLGPEYSVQRELLTAPVSPHFRGATQQAFGPLSVPSFHRRGVSAFGTFDLQYPASNSPKQESGVGKGKPHRDNMGVPVASALVSDDRTYRSSEKRSFNSPVVATATTISNANASVEIVTVAKGSSDGDGITTTMEQDKGSNDIATNKRLMGHSLHHQIQSSELNEIPESRENSVNESQDARVARGRHAVSSHTHTLQVSDSVAKQTHLSLQLHSGKAVDNNESPNVPAAASADTLDEHVNAKEYSTSNTTRLHDFDPRPSNTFHEGIALHISPIQEQVSAEEFDHSSNEPEQSATKED